MDFVAVVDQAIALLRQRGRVTYRTLKRQFQLDDTALEDLTVELIKGQRLAADEDGEVLVWIGDPPSSPAPAAAAPTPAPLGYTPPYLAEKILTSRRALEGERKQVTVLFADLKDSTRLIEGLDPEAARQLLDPALHLMMDAVHRYEGTVNQVLGDGIMALFGAPIAHEDYALRACYAALAMQTALRRYSDEVRRTQGLTLQTRVGLNSGEVVVRTISNDLHMDYSAVGQTVHLAARMEQLATPGTILLTAATLRLVEGLVQVQPLGPMPVKGLTEPVEAYELLGASALRRRLQVAAARGLTRFVGRQHELDTLSQALEQARTGHGQVVALVGEAGVGKSRLVYEVVHSHRTQDWLVLESASVSYGKATAYFPVIDLLKRYARVEDGDDTRTIRARVTGQVLTLDAALQEALPALLGLLDALPDDSPFLTLDPPQRRQRTLDALKRLLLRESQEQPLLLVFEDLHWIDTETQALLDSLVESLPTVRLLLLVNYRPEYQHGWGSKTYYTQVRLDPLPPASAEALLQALLGDDPGLEPLKRLLIARTEGNPFFLEESVRALVETGVLVGVPGAYRLAQALPTIQVPATVQAILAARIDRLPPEEKRLLQTAAVIGTEVPFALLQAIAELPEEALHRGLAHLQAAEFLYETRLFPERDFTFKHALTHEVAYGGLLQERRRALHARIVEALEALAAERVAEQVERLAHHALRGEVWDKALAYCRQAGEKAMARSAHREAVGYLRAGAPRPRASAGDARHTRAGHRSPTRPAHGALRRWETLGVSWPAARGRGPRGGPRRPASAGTGLCLSVVPFLRHGACMTRPSPPPSAPSHSPRPAGMASCRHRRTSTSASPTQPRATIVRRSPVSGRPWRPSTGRGAASASVSPLPAVLSRAYLAWCHAELGTFAEGRALGEEGLQIAEAVAHPGSLMRAYWGLGLLALRQGDLPMALPGSNGPWASVRTRTSRACSARMAAALGAAYTLAGRVAEAVPLLRRRWHRRLPWKVGCPDALSSPPRRGASAGRPSGGGADPRRAGAGARPRAPGTWQPGVCPAPPRRHRGAARSPGGRARRSLLPPGPRSGRGTWHAPAPGPLPPGPGPAVRCDRPAGAGPQGALDGS